MLEDNVIINHFWNRDSAAIEEVQSKYGRLCHSIAFRVLRNEEDTEECVNDTFLRVWNSIPPQRPDSLTAFLSKIVRNLALDRYRYNHAGKRLGAVDDLMSEMNECIPDSFRTEDRYEGQLLTEAINSFLASLPEKKRIAFVRRYWYSCSVKEIAELNGTTEQQVKSMLFRIRKELQEYLEKEGFAV